MKEEESWTTAERTRDDLLGQELEDAEDGEDKNGDGE